MPYGDSPTEDISKLRHCGRAKLSWKAFGGLALSGVVTAARYCLCTYGTLEFRKEGPVSCGPDTRPANCMKRGSDPELSGDTNADRSYLSHK